MNGHSELHMLADATLYCGIVSLIHLQISDTRAHGATDVAAHMVRIDMVGKRNSEAHHNILTGMNIWHNPDFGALKHRMVKEVLDHRQSLLLYVVCKYLAVLAILSLNLYHFAFLYLLFYVVIFKNVTLSKRIIYSNGIEAEMDTFISESITIFHSLRKTAFRWMSTLSRLHSS